MSSTRTRAWVLDVGGGRHVAAGTHHVIEYLLTPEIISLPLAPAHCPGVLVWRERIIPALDILRLLPDQEPAGRAWRGAVILAYQGAPREPLGYGALLVYAPPEEAWVSNDMACPLPERNSAFEYFTGACFAREAEAIPVLDSAKLFSEPVPWSPPEDETEDSVGPVTAASATPAGSYETGAPSKPGESAPAEGANRVEVSKDAGRNGTDTSPRPVPPLPEAPACAAPLMIPALSQVPATIQTPARVERSPEDHRTSRRQRAQRIIEETLVAMRDEVGLKRVMFGVLARDRRSIRAHFYQGVESDSPLRGFTFERSGPTLFARLVEKPQHVWVHAGNRRRLGRLINTDLRASLGEVGFCASSVFVRSKLVGLCYGDAFPSVNGLDEHRYQRFKSFCTLMAKQLEEVAA